LSRSASPAPIAEPGRHAESEALDDHIGPPHQLVDDSPTLVLLQVDVQLVEGSIPRFAL